MKNCIFCKIVNNEVPSYKIYEDEIVLAFLDLSQTTPGHTLVIPKKHVSDIYEYDEKLASEVFARVPKIARAIKKSNPNIKGMHIISNNEEVAYQSVFHSHFHLIPRYDAKDSFSIDFNDNSSKYLPADLSEIQKSITESFGD